MAELPCLPFWTDAYLGDCAHLSDAEHGRYLLLLIAMWRAPKQRLPNDDEWLSRKFSRSVERIVSEFRPLITEFCRTDGNWIWQDRLKREWNFVSLKRQKNSDRSKSGWEKRKRRCSADGEQMLSNAPTPTPLIYENGEVKKIWIAYGTKQGDAWTSFFKSEGKIPPRDSRGGWWFPSEYPPEKAA